MYLAGFNIKLICPDISHQVRLEKYRRGWIENILLLSQNRRIRTSPYVDIKKEQTIIYWIRKMLNKNHIFFIIVVMTLGFKITHADDTINTILDPIIVTSPPREPIILGGYCCNAKVKLNPDKPVVGDQVKITFYLETPNTNIPEYRVTFQLLKGAGLLSGNLIQTGPSLKKGGSSTSSILIKVVSPHLIVFINAHAHLLDPYSRNEWGVHLAGKMIDLLTLPKGEDLSYEKYGNDPDVWPRIGPEYLYDIVEGTRTPSVGRVTEEAKEIRKEIEVLQQRDSTLTDWDALELLHDVIYEMIVRYGLNKKEESVNILLQARVLMKKEGLSKWEAVDKIISGK